MRPKTPQRGGGSSMPKRAWLVSRGAVGAALSILLASCGSDTSSGGNDGGTGGDGSTSAGSGAPTTCIVGTQGCLCDSTGGCAPSLTCTTQPSPRPPLCCNGPDCTSVGGTVGGT